MDAGTSDSPRIPRQSGASDWWKSSATWARATRWKSSATRKGATPKKSSAEQRAFSDTPTWKFSSRRLAANDEARANVQNSAGTTTGHWRRSFSHRKRKLFWTANVTCLDGRSHRSYGQCHRHGFERKKSDGVSPRRSVDL